MRYTVAQAARELGVHAATLTRWERAGKIPRARRDSDNVRWWDQNDLACIRQWQEQIARLRRGVTGL